MCGIVGYIGRRQSQKIILSGLKRLEYRGYDSAGIATFNEEKISVTKCSGKVTDLEKKLSNKPHSSTMGIGHTRWATHGAPNDNNAHPHIDFNNKIVVVHNGIFENYSSIKQLLLENGIYTKTDTDTEVIAQFIGFLYSKEKDFMPFNAILRMALKEVVGTYGLLVMCLDQPEKIYAAKSGAPLVIGVGDGENFIASDTSPIIEHTRNIVYLDEEEIAVVTKDDYKVLGDDNSVVVPKEIETIKYSLDQIEKGGYEHFMLKEIFEQFSSVSESIRGRIAPDIAEVRMGGISGWTNNILEANQIYITACGTSWHAGLIGGYMIEEVLGIPVKVEYASELRYRKAPIDSKTVVMAISQSGETADTLATIRKSKEKGATTVGIVNVVGSTIARETDCGVYIHAGPEIGVASTKAFTSQVTILCLMTLYLAQKKGVESEDITQMKTELITLTEKVKTVLKVDDLIKKIAIDYKDSQNFLYLGRGYQFPVALEGALKLKEISYIHAEGYPAAEMKHGPIALIDEKMPVVAVVTHRAYDKIVSNIQQVKARGGKVIIVTSEVNKELENFSEHIIEVPSIHHCLSPIINIIPLQLLAYHIAVLRRCNVDQPRNLAKSVTVE
ncbi:MAG: glutamine--fructose-6-phosphate transaminase (isomerizing) [bacterium TMED198]|nr:MAG: glutamine--fructose-6-phosphate transaminase (isomerizing) [bacterium TMED198]|tara:strand:- start:67 stop:1908 length:1842 start_codon:yes stop_codon:yes gene_type:complete